MMKLSDCNTQQRKAHANIYHAGTFILNEMFHDIKTCDTDSPQYLRAKQLLNRDRLIEEIYKKATSGIYNRGCRVICCNEKSLLEEILSCGEDWIMERCKERVELEYAWILNPAE